MPTIRDNKFNIYIPNDSSNKEYEFLLDSGEFHIKDHKVTEGQPSGIKNGDILHCDSNGEFNFLVGRHESREVADWFNKKCDPRINTTFGHPAENLNFAIMGTLLLTISRGSKKYKISFEDILIAQGHVDIADYWWFGGKNCLKTTDYQVISDKTSEDNNNFRFTFRKGENFDHVVKITNIELFTWMKNIDDKILLNEINIPGTHDSATYNYDTPITEDFVKTQNLSIRGQLDIGIRFIDIRCRHVNNSFKIVHGDYDVHLSFSEVLDQCTSFLRKNNSETIIMLLKEEGNPELNSREFYKTFLDYVDKTRGYWLKFENYIPTLKLAREKIVLMYRFDFKENSFGINCTEWSNNATFTIRNKDLSLKIQDEYSVSFLYQKQRAIERQVEESMKKENLRYYINYISLAPSYYGNINYVSKLMNDVMFDTGKNKKEAFLGLIVMNYPNNKKDLVPMIIDRNKLI